MINVASSRGLLVSIVFCICSFGIYSQAESADARPDARIWQTSGASGSVQAGSSEQDPLLRPRPEPKVDKKLEKAYGQWLEEVSLIILPEERDAFRKLRTDAERQSFIEIFWRHRDPTPDTEENEYKEEFYRRRAYANERFSAGVPGWKTDRGRMYILHGPPDSIDSHPAGGPYQRTAEEGGGSTTTYPFEIWRYRHLDGIGQEVEIEFVDTCGCGNYHMTLNRGEKDALARVPGAAPTDMEALGLAKQADRSRGLETLGPSLFGNNLSSKEFDRIQQMSLLNAPPPVGYARLTDPETVKSTIRTNPLFFDVRVDFAKADAQTVVVPITIQVANRELGYAGKDGLQHAALELYGRLTTLSGKVTNTFEEPLRLDVPSDLMEKFAARESVYQEILPVKPGRYRLDVILKDVNSGKVGVSSRSIIVPDLTSPEKLAASTLIPADVMEPVSPRDIGSGSFILGINRVRPRVPAANGEPATFTHDQKVNLWMQVYNLALDSTTKRPSATVEYHVVNVATGASALDLSESTDQIGNIGSQVTLQRSLPANALAPGVYEVTVKVNDLVAHDSIAPTTRFAVR